MMCYAKHKSVSHHLSPQYWHDNVLRQTQSSVTWSVLTVLTWWCAMPNTKKCYMVCLLSSDMMMCYAKHKEVSHGLSPQYWCDDVLCQTQRSSVPTWQCAIPNTKQLCTDMMMYYTKHKAALYWHDSVLLPNTKQLCTDMTVCNTKHK